jgi:hypothetical protein
MDSVTSRSTPKLHRATQAIRMLLVETGQGIHLIATCLLNAQTSQMSIAEIYEWFAQKYPEYQYTKRKIRKVLKHDSERKCPRFVIANTSDSRESHFARLFGLEQKLNFAGASVALPLLSVRFLGSIVAFLK